MWRIGVVLFLLALTYLLFFKAPTNFLWKLSVALTEFPFVPLIVVLLIGIWFWFSPSYRTILLFGNIICLGLFASTYFRTYARTTKLKQELTAVFGVNDSKTGLEFPFSFWRQFRSYPKNIYTTFKYNSQGTWLNADFYAAKTKAKAPVVIVIHGGSWREGDSQQLPDLNPYLASKGVNVISMCYRMAPKHQYPAPIEDVDALIQFLETKVNEWQLDLSQIVLLGRSAGGQIALQAAYTKNNPSIKGVVSFYAPADMLWGAQIETNDWVLDVDKVLVDYIGGKVKEVPEKYKASSAPYFVTENTPPTLLIHGVNDAMVYYLHSVRLIEKLKANGIPAYLLDLPQATHGCDYNFNGPSGQTSTFAIEHFLATVFRTNHAK